LGVDCYEVNTMVKTGMYSDSKVSVIKLLNDIHFLALNNPSEIQLGSVCILVSLHAVLQTSYPKDQYIPALKYRELPPVKSKRKQQVNGFDPSLGDCFR